MRIAAGRIQQKYENREPSADECRRRRWAGGEALARGHGGISRVARATGLSRMTAGRRAP